MSWVHLDPGEVLAVHTHPIASLLLCARGRAHSIGAVEGPLEDGDIVTVSPGDLHGFVGDGPEGIWAVSIQFEPRALYEDLSDPWVSFTHAEAGSLKNLEQLLRRNDEHIKTFLTHRIFSNVKIGRFNTDESRQRLMDGVRVWCEHRERLTHLWVALSQNALAANLAAADSPTRLRELAGPQARRRIWDPFLEASSSWFPAKLPALSDAERYLLMKLVVAPAEEILLRKLSPLLSKAPGAQGESGPFEPGGIDPAMAAAIFDWGSASTLVDEAWSMTSALCGRIADLAVR
jgi:hypothetical protein